MRIHTILVATALLIFVACGSGDQNLQSRLDSRAVVQDEIVTMSGRLVNLAAVGGESTGYGLENNNGITEIDLVTHGFTSRFVETQFVRLTGRYETIAGIERTRPVLVVEDLNAVEP